MNQKLPKNNYSPLVLCVCSGNVGRSPIMEEKLRSLFLKHGLGGKVRVASAGLQGTGGVALPRFSRLSEYPEGDITLPLLEERGLDISMHSYQAINEDLVREAAIILIPSEDIRSLFPNALTRQFPQYKDKIILLSELVNRQEDVPDFADCFDPQIHRKAIDMICEFFEKGFDRICRLLGIS